MLGVFPLYLDKSDLLRQADKKPIEKISWYDFKISREDITRSDLVVYFDSEINTMKILKCRYKIIT